MASTFLLLDQSLRTQKLERTLDFFQISVNTVVVKTITKIVSYTQGAIWTKDHKIFRESK